MSCVELTKSLEAHGLDGEEYFAVLAEQEKRILPEIRVRPGRGLGELSRISDYADVLRQVLLHRAIKLTKSAGLSLVDENGYSLALSVRAHFETTASIGYLHYRQNSMREGNISPQVMDKDIMIQLLGSRDDGILNTDGAEGFDAKQILTMLEYADKSVSKHIFGERANEHKMLMDIYKWLCEFCHPNFHSNKLAFDLNRQRESFVFRHERPLNKNESNVLGNLFISAPIFVALYDGIERLLPC